MRARTSTVFTALMRPTNSNERLTGRVATGRTPTAGAGAAAAVGPVFPGTKTNHTAATITITAAAMPAIHAQRCLAVEWGPASDIVRLLVPPTSGFDSQTSTLPHHNILS